MAELIRGIGAMVYETGLDGLDRRLAMLDEVGFDLAELAIAALGAITGGRLVPARVHQIEARLAKRRVGHTVHAPLALNLMDEAHAPLHLAVGRACLEFCAAIGAAVLVVHPGWVPPALLAARRDDLLAMEREALAQLAELGERFDVTIALENMPVILETVRGELDNHGIDPASVAAQLAAIDHPRLVATIDFSHAYISARHLGRQLEELIAPLVPWCGHLHVHDSFGRVPTLERASTQENIAFGMGDLHLPLGWGDLPFKAVLPDLAIRPGSAMTLEINTPYQDAETMAACLARGRDLAVAMNARGVPDGMLE